MARKPRAPRGPSKRTVINRAALEAVRLGAADGLQELGQRILEITKPMVPDQPPTGQGLVESGQAATYVDGKKVAGQGTAPRGAAGKAGTVMIVGYGFPGRFQEIGTKNMPANPFLTPGMVEAIPDAAGQAAQAIKRRLARVRS